MEGVLIEPVSKTLTDLREVKCESMQVFTVLTDLRELKCESMQVFTVLTDLRELKSEIHAGFHGINRLERTEV